MNNSTAIAIATETPKHDKNDTPQDVVVASHQLTTGPFPVPRQKPTISLLRAACDAFHIKGGARLLAFELLSYWSPNGTVFPSVATLAAGMGLKTRMVRYHLAHLERVGLWVRHDRSGTTNTYELRLPGGVQPIAGGGRQSIAPISNHVEVTTEEVQRKHCACGNSWPSEFGPTCYKCMKDPPQPSLAPERPTKTALTEASEDQLRAVGWHKGKEGAWSRAT